MAKKLDLKEGKVLMFKRDKTKDTQPDYGGQMKLSDEMIDKIQNGEDQFDIAVYVNRSESGVEYLNGEIRVMWVNPNESSNGGIKTESNNSQDEDDDDLPF
jgi:hypothetical protein